MINFAPKFIFMKFKITGIFFLALMIFSCGEYNKVLKMTDYNAKFDYAKKYFDLGKYNRAATLLEDVVPVTRNTARGEEALYLLARSYYSMKDYQTAAEYFKSYYTSYPKGEYAELARYYAAYGLYLDSPDARLDQADTYKSMQLLQDFIDIYPLSERKDDAQKTLFELQEKLALKELLAVKLYYNLGDYVLGMRFEGGNYTSCLITAQNAMRDYPFSKYREDFVYYMFKSRYEMAIKSIDAKKEFRYRDVVDEYYSYINEYPEGKYLKEIKKLYANIEKEMQN
jgi:outer membrane protein assembly factor BamD